jgi:acyl transferase domain-containing protein
LIDSLHSLTVDTACSSSLYALHLACQGLLLRDFDAAVVAGTNIIMDVLHQVTATKLGILSPTSTCHTFDARADGFGRAEGITVLYVKRLSDAVANGDPIRAVIRATAIYTNGKGSMGISHPGLQGQEAVIRQAYSKARLDFGETAYLECHGTGTPVGDPIEVAAAGNIFAHGRSSANPILLSSVKSQIGHTEGASGIAAIQKVVMALENGVVPASVGISKLNPARKVSWYFDEGL